MKKLLELRKAIKKKHPKFLRQDYHKWDRLENKYRRPKGGQSKVRHKLKSRLVYVQIGYRTPALTRHLTNDGLKNIRVQNVLQLEKINPKEEAITIADVGQKKKVDIVKAAMAKKIKILNVKEDFLKIVEEKLKLSKAQKEKKLEAKKAKDDKKKKETKKEEKESKDLSEDDKKKKEKEEKDKVLTSKH